MSKTYDELKRAEQFRQGSTITSGIRIKGEVEGSEDLIVNGILEGPIHLKQGKVTVGNQGKVSGDVNAAEVEVLGSVTGNVTAANRLEIKATGSIIGDVVTPRIVIEDGAHYKGSIAIGND